MTQSVKIKLHEVSPEAELRIVFKTVPDTAKVVLKIETEEKRNVQRNRRKNSSVHFSRR